MSFSRREFMQVLAVASAGGMALNHSDVLAAAPGAGERLYDVPKFGNVSFLHFTDCHAQLKPIYFREPNVNLGFGSMKGQLPHLVGEHLLKYAGLKAGSVPGLVGRGHWQRFADAYQRNLTTQGLPLSYQVLFIFGQMP